MKGCTKYVPQTPCVGGSVRADEKTGCDCEEFDVTIDPCVTVLTKVLVTGVVTVCVTSA